MQTSYSYNQAAGFAGLVADSRDATITSKVNPVVAIALGVAVCRGVDGDRDVKLPTTAAEAAACIGVAVANASMESSTSGDPQYPVSSAVPVLEKGPVWVTVEETVAAGDKAYVRYADGIADGTKTQKGAFRKTPDGTAMVETLTPTPVNSFQYHVNLSGFDSAGNYYSETFTYNSDASATAAEIVTGLSAAINASTVPVTASGTTTLILTADVAGVPFVVNCDGNLAVAHTTANAQSAALCKGMVFETGASAGGLAKLVCNKPAA